MSDKSPNDTMDLFSGSPGPGEAPPAPGGAAALGAAPTQGEKRRSAPKYRGVRLSMTNAGKIGTTAAAVRSETAVDAGELGYFSQLLVQTALPHKDPGDVAAWTRQNGRFSLTFSNTPQFDPETKSHQRVGLPFGTHARLIFAWLGTEAVRTRSRTIELGDSFGAFMRRLQIPRSGGPRGSEAALRKQLLRITWSPISWTYHQGKGPSAHSFDRAQGHLDAGQNVFPIETRLFYWDPADPDKRSLWQSEITLNDTFYRHLLQHNVPVDMRVMRELARMHSSLAMDIYAWWTSRMHGLEKPTPCIPWRKLMEQLGTTHDEAHEFARDFKAQAHKVRILYPEAQIQYVRGGIKLFPSPTHVPERALLAGS